MLKCAKINLCLLSHRIDFRILLQSSISSMFIDDFSDIYSLKPARIPVSYQFSILLISLK